MRALSLCLGLLLTGCPSSNHEGGELSREQCQELVRHVQTLEAVDLGGSRESLHAGRRSNVEGCLRRGTERAHRCVMQAEKTADLGSCESLYK